MNRAERRRLGLRGLVEREDDMIERAVGRRDDIKHGICKGPRCSKRTILWLPAELCEKCLLSVATELGEMFNEDAVQNGGVR